MNNTAYEEMCLNTSSNVRFSKEEGVKEDKVRQAEQVKKRAEQFPQYENNFPKFERSLSFDPLGGERLGIVVQ